MAATTLLRCMDQAAGKMDILFPRHNFVLPPVLKEGSFVVEESRAWLSNLRAVAVGTSLQAAFPEPQSPLELLPLLAFTHPSWWQDPAFRIASTAALELRGQAVLSFISTLQTHAVGLPPECTELANDDFLHGQLLLSGWSDHIRHRMPLVHGEIPRGVCASAAAAIVGAVYVNLGLDDATAFAVNFAKLVKEERPATAEHLSSSAMPAKKQ